jgi:hypothetical protein
LLVSSKPSICDYLKFLVESVFGWLSISLLQVDCNSWLRFSIIFKFSAWSSIFILLIKVIKLVERKFNRFLWNGSELSPAKSKVALDHICVPKIEGIVGLLEYSGHFKAYMVSLL